MFLEMTLWASLLDPLLGSEGRASAYQAEDGRFKSRRNSLFSSTCTKKCLLFCIQTNQTKVGLGFGCPRLNNHYI